MIVYITNVRLSGCSWIFSGDESRDGRCRAGRNYKGWRSEYLATNTSDRFFKSSWSKFFLHSLACSQMAGWVVKKGRSGVCALWSVTEPSRRRRKVSKWLHEDDDLDTGGELPINALPQRTNETQTNNLRATRSIPQLTARPTIMPLPGSIFVQLTTCLLLGSASTPPQ